MLSKNLTESGMSEVDFYIIKYNAEKQERLTKIRSYILERYPVPENFLKEILEILEQLTR